MLTVPEHRSPGFAFVWMVVKTIFLSDNTRGLGSFPVGGAGIVSLERGIHPPEQGITLPDEGNAVGEVREERRSAGAKFASQRNAVGGFG
jgi:hypothetical protein